MKAVLVLLSGIVLAPSVQAAPKPKKTFSLKEFLSPSASLRMGYFQRNKEDVGDTGFLSNSAWLQMKSKRVYKIGFSLDANIQASDISRKRNSYEGDLRELYSFGNLHRFDLKLGRQIIVWGRADKINPTDSLSVRDSTFLVTNDEDQRTGLFTAQETFNFNDYRLIAIWQPEWRKTKLPIPPLPEGVTLSHQRPENADRQFALKFDRSGGAFDYSVSYFSGLDKTPDLGLAPGGGLDVLFTYNPIQVFGVDAAFNIGEFGIRAEAAYTKTDDDDGTDVTIKNSFFYGVIGADRFIGENFNFNIQYLFRSIGDRVSPETISDPTAQLLAEQVELLANQQQSTQHGMTLKLTHRAFEQALESELSFLTWFQQSDFSLRPKLTYSISDHWKMIVGGEYYAGPDNSYLGRLKPYSTAFGEVRYYF